jgi:hypothetical protein
MVMGHLPGNGGAKMIMIIRHAEKPDDSGGVLGVTADGKHDPESLIVQGWTRAGALIGLFDPRAADGGQLPPRPGLARPASIFASDPGGHGSKRPLETITPLAAALGITPNTQYDKGDEAALAAGLAGAPDPVLISWQHESIPAIIANLGQVTPAPPASWPGPRFDMVYVFNRDSGGWTFSQIPQMLLAGDSATPFG